MKVQEEGVEVEKEVVINHFHPILKENEKLFLNLKILFLI